MAEQVKRPVGITETVLRDAHQSLMSTRMTTEQMLPIVEKMDQVGYHSVECWGGATFDASLRFLKEDPWERLRKLRAGFKHTKLQMLFRGQNILGYNHYADDVVEYFVQKSVANGMDIIRIFDCFNDLRNLKTAVNATKAIKKENPNAEAQIALCYTLGDAYTLDYWKKIAKEIESMGADSICIKDKAGLLVPYKATELVTALKSATKLPIQIHTHYTSGVASMTYMKAVEAGADVIDTAMSPLAMGTSQPATEVMVEAFKGTEFDTGLDQNKLAEIEVHQQTLNDAERIRATGCRAIQINTGEGCHLDADMIEEACRKIKPEPNSILFIENVGNLVCPAAFDLGEDCKVVVLSVTEGEDKPIKYPDMFAASSLMLINKVDLLPYVDFSVEKCKEYARRVNPNIEFIEVSATKGTGMDAWCDWLGKRFSTGSK